MAKKRINNFDFARLHISAFRSYCAKRGVGVDFENTKLMADFRHYFKKNWLSPNIVVRKGKRKGQSVAPKKCYTDVMNSRMMYPGHYGANH